MFTFDGTCWLTPGEQQEAIRILIESGLILCDNKRGLKLKSGGFTDIYANLRLMRSQPTTMADIAQLFENPIRRLHPDRIIEVPEAVSPMAGHLSVITGIPLVTVREEAKPGRVVKGVFIGELKAGDRVVIVDDVVTDGESKIAALRALRGAGVHVLAIVVLVDRQQGWKEKLAKAGFGDINVWAGLTLHDIRKYLVTNGLMERCDPAIEAQNPLVLALDGKTWDEVLPVIDRLRPTGCILKANDLLDTGGLNKVVSDLSVYGRVMVDRKFDDIPNTIANYCKRLRPTPPWGFTLHANGGSAMIKAAVEAFADTPTIVLAITVLTSLQGECKQIFKREPIQQVGELAKLAWAAGARGFVCSADESEMLRMMYPSSTIVVPGLNSPARVAQKDQKRTATFADARKLGASFLVGGRQFFNDPDPAKEVLRVLKDELHIEV